MEQVLSSTTSAYKKEVVVDVAGAVIRPGVYKIPADGWIKDAVIIEGGLAENADRNFVDKQINLAQKLTDGAKVYIPKLGENTQSSSAIRSNQEVLQL